jgi:hypothetical protein
MKSINQILATSVVVCGLSLTAGPTMAQTQDFIVNQFNDSTEADQWTRWWGNAVQTYEFDPAVDASGNANSGSLKATIEFDLAQWVGENQFAVQHNFGASLDGTQFTNLVFDLRFDTNSPTRPTSRDFGFFEYGLIPADFSQITLGAVTVAATNSGWTHVVTPIDPTTAKLSNIIGVWSKVWAGDASAGGNNKLTGTTVFWLDNVKLIANTNTAPPAAPTMAIQKAIPGLQLFASKAGSQYQRQNIYTLNTSYSWVNSANPVTYSLTISNYPDTNHTGFQTHMFLVPGSSLPTFESSPDYNEPNVVFLDIQNQANGSAYASFRYKTNQANGNSMLYNADSSAGPVGTLAGIGSPSALGTWSLTFSNNTSVALASPSGTSTNFNLPADSAALFADPMYVYVGVQPNNLNNIGQSVTLSRIQITGVAAPLDDKFTGPTLDADTWQVAAEDPTGVVAVPPDSIYSLSWTLPDTGFVVQAGPLLVPASWGDPGLTNLFQIVNRRRVLVPSSSLPGTNSGFFRLIKQP